MAKSSKKSKPTGLRWVAVSGGFDPIHVGHIRLMREAKKLGDKLVVILNNDNWLKNKKGFTFMPERERMELIRSFSFVDRVVLTGHKLADPDRSIVRSLKKIHPAIFANGGDRFAGNIPEHALCKKLGIKMVFNVGRGGKVQSSSWVIGKASREARRSVRPWGEFYGWDSGKKWYVKTMYVKPNKRLSLQYHRNRSERWILVKGELTAVIMKNGIRSEHPLKVGETFVVSKGTIHRLMSKRGGTVVEVAIGSTFNEGDIVRLEDDHGRATA